MSTDKKFEILKSLIENICKRNPSKPYFSIKINSLNLSPMEYTGKKIIEECKRPDFIYKEFYSFEEFTSDLVKLEQDHKEGLIQINNCCLTINQLPTSITGLVTSVTSKVRPTIQKALDVLNDALSIT